MKQFILVLMLISSHGALAFINDFECETVIENQRLRVDVERNVGPVRYVRASVEESGRIMDEEIYYARFRRIRPFNELEFWSANMDLRIDLFPDTRPFFGRRYQSRFQSRHFFDNELIHFDCQYTGF